MWFTKGVLKSEPWNIFSHSQKTQNVRYKNTIWFYDWIIHYMIGALFYSILYILTSCITFTIAKWWADEICFATLAIGAVSCTGTFDELATCFGDLRNCYPHHAVPWKKDTEKYSWAWVIVQIAWVIVHSDCQGHQQWTNLSGDKQVTQPHLLRSLTCWCCNPVFNLHNSVVRNTYSHSI